MPYCCWQEDTDTHMTAEASMVSCHKMPSCIDTMKQALKIGISARGVKWSNLPMSIGVCYWRHRYLPWRFIDIFTYRLTEASYHEGIHHGLTSSFHAAKVNIRPAHQRVPAADVVGSIKLFCNAELIVGRAEMPWSPSLRGVAVISEISPMAFQEMP